MYSDEDQRTNIMKTKILFITSLLLIVGCSKPTTYSDLNKIDGFIIEIYGMIYRNDSWTHVPSITYKGINQNNTDYYELGTYKEYIKHNSKIVEPYTGEIPRYYTSGELLCIDTFENGQLIDFKYFNKDSTIKEIVDTNSLFVKDDIYFDKKTNDIFSGVVSGYKDNSMKNEYGTFYSQTSYKGRIHNGKKEDVWMEYNTSYSYEGESENLHDLPKVYSITNYKNGKKNGIHFQSSGSYLSLSDYPSIDDRNLEFRLLSGYFKNDKMVGWWIFRRNNWDIRSEMYFKDGELDGFYRTYVNQRLGDIESGHYQSKGRYLNGEKIGVWLNRGGSRREPTKELEIINNVRHPDSRWYQYPYKTEE